MASMHAASAPVRAVRTPAGNPAWLVSGYDKVRALTADSRLSWTTSAAGASRYSRAAMMRHPDASRAEAERTTIQAEAAASHNRAALDQLPQIVQQAARGLSGVNVTVLTSTDGLGSVRQNLGNDAPGTASAVRQEEDQ